jgi:hypothetical protein
VTDRLKVFLPDDWAKSIRSEASQTGQSISSIIRRMIRQAMIRHGPRSLLESEKDIENWVK